MQWDCVFAKQGFAIYSHLKRNSELLTNQTKLPQVSPSISVNGWSIVSCRDQKENM